MDLYIKFIAGLVYAYGLVILNYAIFKIRVSGKDKQIMILALAFAATNFYFKFVQDSNIFLVTQVIVYTIVMSIVRKYPLLYALVVSTVGIIVIAIIEVIVTSGVIALKISTIEVIKNSTLPFVMMHILIALIFLLLAWVFIKYKIGFTFVVRKFSSKNTLKTSTFVWSFFLVIALAALQFISQNFKLLSQSSLSVIFSSIALCACIVYAYYQNKKSLVERFGEIKKVS